MRKISTIGKELKMINEGFEFDPQDEDNSLYEEPLDKNLKESLIEALQQPISGEVITEHREKHDSHKKQRKPLMTFERFMKHNHN